ncbi:MAG: phosphatase PAP2/dual specificity phosphatase family protein [Bryobacteraceae bacterium]
MTAAGTGTRGHPAADERRPWPLAILWLAGLTPFFFLSYGFANWVTGLRHNVPELAFGWERRIPFLPWTIVPYWTTDFFYAGSLLLCRTRAELRTQGLRLITVQALCVAGFLLVPLQFTFARPHASGLFGSMFDALMSFDRPFNQAPSLHVALTAVLWAAYSRHMRGWPLWLVRGWFVLMALSTLTTYQHHFIDLPTGLGAGLFTMMLFPVRGRRAASERSRDPRRFRLAAVYLAGAAIAGVLAWRLGGLAWILLWPAAALAVVAGIYWIGRPELFRKSESGAMTPAAIGVLAPYLLGAWLNSRWHTRHQPPAQEISSGVWLGRIPRRAEREALGIHSVVDLTAELPFASEGIAYRSIPMLDLLTPTIGQLEAAAEAIEDFGRARPTLVCCALGYSRSAAAVAAWMMATGRASSAGEAVEAIRARRPVIVVPAAYRAALERLTDRAPFGPACPASPQQPGLEQPGGADGPKGRPVCQTRKRPHP